MNTKIISPPHQMQVNGRFIMIVIQSLESTPAVQRVFISLLEKQGLKDINPYSWVQYKPFLLALEEVASSISLTFLGELFGKKLPFAFVNFKSAVAAYYQFYKTTHRMFLFEGDDIGFYKIISSSEEKFIVEEKSYYPVDFSKGILLYFYKKTTSKKIIDLKIQKFENDRFIYLFSGNFCSWNIFREFFLILL